MSAIGEYRAFAKEASKLRKQAKDEKDPSKQADLEKQAEDLEEEARFCWRVAKYD